MSVLTWTRTGIGPVYNNLNQLTHAHEEAGGFYDELGFNDGATGRARL